MKTGNSHWFKLILVAAMLMLANRSHAYYTNYLDVVSNILTGVYTTLTNDPSSTPAERQQIALIGKALRTLAKPSTNVAGDYNLFVTAATQLGPIAAQPDFLALGTNVFHAFTNEAQAQIIATGNRIAALNQFVVTRKAASNSLNQAQKALDRIPTLTDIRVALVVGRQVFSKINTANKLAAIGEAHSGFARNTVIGKRIEHTEQGETGEVFFNNNVQASQDAPLDSTYTYTRTGLNTATLVLVRNEGTSTSTTTVKLRFTSANAGRFTFRNEDSDGGVERGAGTFTID